ncbi:hypothetical protein L7F22_005608 [Adiantum nelumboides]|nr:hypothetical protein [Adiantum nelumboides]
MTADTKLKEAEELIKKANKQTKLSFFKWSTDWSSATALYEQAAIAFKLAKQLEKAKDAYERAAEGQERLSSYGCHQWIVVAAHGSTDGWKCMERPLVSMVSRMIMAKACVPHEIIRAELVAALLVTEALARRASNLYGECGMPQPSADALAKGARALEEGNPDEALKLYLDSCGILEEEGKEQMAFETYRAAMSLYLKKERHLDAANMLLRWGLAADKSKAVHTQCKTYLSAIIVYLYAHDLKQAEQCYNDCSQVDAFANSEHFSCAFELFRAYREGDAEGIKHTVKSSSVIPHLDHMIVRLAKQLPSGDVEGLASSVDNLNLEDDDFT